MLPPIDPGLLDRHPLFGALVQDITTRRLNADGSTRHGVESKARKGVRERLRRHRIEAAKAQILRDGLKHIAHLSSSLTGTSASKNDDLDSELREVVRIVNAQLSGRVPPQDRELLEDDVEFFLEHITQIATALSTHLTSTATHISRIAAASSPPPPPSDSTAATEPHQPTLEEVPVADLPTTFTALESSTTTLRHSLSALRTSNSIATESLLRTRSHLAEAQIQYLERRSSGTASRALRARAEHLATVAKGMRLKMEILERSAATNSASGAEMTQVDGGRMRAAMQRYARHLDGVEGGLRERLEEAEGKLAAYEGGVVTTTTSAAGQGAGTRSGLPVAVAGQGSKGNVLMEIAKRDQEIEAEMAVVREEIARLEARKKEKKKK